MKKIIFALALVTFSGSIATQVYASSQSVKKEIRDDDKKKKKKKKKACCSASAMEQKKCCSSGSQSKTSGCTEKH